MFKLIKASLNQRRKTILNGIANSKITSLSKNELENVILSLGYDINLRGETLSVEDFAKISDEIF